MVKITYVPLRNNYRPNRAFDMISQHHWITLQFEPAASHLSSQIFDLLSSFFRRRSVLRPCLSGPFCPTTREYVWKMCKWTSFSLVSPFLFSEASCPFKVRARAPSDFWAKWMLNAASKRQKNSRIIFSIFDTITPAWLNRSACHIISC